MDKRRVSKYCLVLISDYVAVVAALSATVGSGGGGGSATMRVRVTSQGAAEGPSNVAAFGAAGSDKGKAALSALRRGAFCLLSCISPTELQHLHTVMGLSGTVSHQGLSHGMGGSAIGAAGLRAALLALRTEYDKNYKFEGKV